MHSYAFKESTSESNGLQSFAILHSSKRSKTQRKQTQRGHQSDVVLSQNSPALIPLIDKPSDFPSIFSKRKRIEYSGYKQCNLNKSKFISFEEQNRKSEHQPMRQYQMNLKNISKLRKRYSLQPQYLRNTQSKQKSMYQTSCFKPKEDNNVDLVDSESKHHRNLRQIMKRFIERSEDRPNLIFQTKKENNTHDNHDDNRENLHVQSQLGHFHRYKDKEQETGKQKVLNRSSVEYATPKFGHLQVNRKLTQKLIIRQSKLGFKMTTRPVKTQITPQVDQQLCGWQNRTFFH